LLREVGLLLRLQAAGRPLLPPLLVVAGWPLLLLLLLGANRQLLQPLLLLSG
jgi:hypothetical protein